MFHPVHGFSLGSVTPQFAPVPQCASETISFDEERNEVLQWPKKLVQR